MLYHKSNNLAKRRFHGRLSIHLTLAALCLLILVNCGSGSDSEDAPATTAVEEVEAEAIEAEPEPTEVAIVEEEAVEEEPAEEEVAPNVYFKMPTANAIVPTTFSVTMGAEGVAVDPAGDILENSGHMHILVDTDFVEAGSVIPKDDNHLHYGDGSVMTELELSPGSHTLRLQLANGAHIALEGDEYRDEIVVTVKEDAAASSVRFSSPLDGAVVAPSFDISMAAAGLLVEPAGEIVDGSGHLHILVDTDFVPAGEVIINDEKHLHFGAGQLATTLDLTPGEHVLRLQLANGAHIALDGEQYRDEITVTVEDGAAAQSVRFVAPADGDATDETFAVQMSAAGLFVDGAGAVMRESGGHMHILVDTDFIEAGNVIPKDEQHIHFGGGQTMAELTLSAGEHTLRLQMANGAHIAMDGDQYRDEIVVTVGEATANSKDKSKENAKEDTEAMTETSDDAVAASEESVALREPQELWTAMACSACHNLDEVQTADNFGQPGPHVGNLFETADMRVAGQSAIEYVTASIITPNEYVNEGYVAGIMPQNFAEQMNDDEIASLVAWMLDPEQRN